jgi:hypothetical protein
MRREDSEMPTTLLAENFVEPALAHTGSTTY